ncbi:PAS domain S-box protein [Nostocaceae cyanobacterium CENA357]|uniref:histidine kinase n=1 Tax=Atlanticothrix silvestris CENA357 TaxID=1725252 RepID=A0A8J7HDE0_9CYAN|nr:ATP-binding protein [Atlanticothrix silvestris]MBH8551160.1 PAS domain S-box protein [Atlanticothrix silvestris CENA357]
MFKRSSLRKSGAKNIKQQVEKQPLLQSIFEKAYDAIAVTDDRGTFIEVNAAACQLFGLSHTALIGRILADFTDTEFDFAKICFNVQAGSQQTGKFDLLRPDGILREVEYTLTLNVVPQRHLMILRDITDRKKAAEDELWCQRQWVELFSEVTLKIRQSLQLKEILRATVTEVQRILQADRVLIYQVLPDGTGKAISEAVLPNYPTILDLEFPEEVFPQEYQKLYAEGRVRAITDVHNPDNELAQCLIEFIDQFDIKSKLIVPILQNLNSHQQSESNSQNQLWGLLIAHHCDRPRQWVNFELEVMQQLADQISIALAQAQLLENLEEIVEVRTAELKDVNRNLHQEINDRMQAESALRRSEEQLRLITNALPVFIAYVDDQQQYRFNNKAYEDWLGKSPANIHGCHIQQVWGEDCYQRMQIHVEAALLGHIVTYENEIVLCDGNSRSFNITYIPHIDEQKIVKGFFSLASDISDRKAIERTKDEFISVVSHELRTPLTSLHSALKILVTGRLGTLSTDGQQMLEIADENTERLVRLVNNVLDLQRIELGKFTMEKQVCKAADFMIQATEAMQPMAQQHGVTLVTQPVDIQIWVDSDYIVQALTNLLSNAIKFSLPGGTVWLTAECQQASQVLFCVHDQGQGIPQSKLETIFERFQQVDSSDSRKKGGTGLGLAICRKIIEQHEGKIWAESILGEGSSFYFTLPNLPG